MSGEDSKTSQVVIKKEPGSDNQQQQQVNITSTIANSTSNNTISTSSTTNLAPVTPVTAASSNPTPTNSTVNPNPVTNQTNTPNSNSTTIKVVTNQVTIKNETSSTNQSLVASTVTPAINTSSSNKTTSINAAQLLNKTTEPTTNAIQTPPIHVITNNTANATCITTDNGTTSNTTNNATTSNAANNSTTSNVANNATTTTTTTNTTAQTNGETSSTDDKSSPVVVLNKQRLQELVAEIDSNEQLDEDVEDVLLNIADDFIDNLVSNACLLAKHRGSKNVEVKDVQLILEKNYNMYIPGFGSLPLNEEFKNVYKKSPATEAHKQRMALIKKTLKKF